MTLPYSEHPEATEERLEAIRYYYGERAELGEEIASRFRIALREVRDSPDAWPPVRGWHDRPSIRSRKIGVFPYRVVYYVRGADVVIIAYAHERRRPGYWRRRLGS